MSANDSDNANPCFELLESQRLDRVEARSSPRRVVAEEDTDCSRKHESDSDRVRRNTSRPLKGVGDCVRADRARSDADSSTEETQDHRFNEELTKHVATPSADGLPQADL